MSLKHWQAVHSSLTGAILLIGVLQVSAAAPLLVVSAPISFVVLAYLSRAELGRARLANALTASRLFAVLSVLTWHWSRQGQVNPAWLAIAILVQAEITDYFDGRAARRGPPTRFGATFDMEVDAYVTAALALQAVLYRQAPGWLLVAGLWRYVYALWEAALTGRWRRTGRTLPCEVNMPSWSRWQAKTICVVSVIGLVGLTLPELAAPLVRALSLGVVSLLSYSFITGTVLLLRRGALRAEPKLN